MKTFAKGSTTFVCECCGHNTRYTGNQSIGSKTCPACYDLAGIENMIQDNQFTDKDAEEAASIFREIQKRSEAEFLKAQKSHDLVWGHPLVIAALAVTTKQGYNVGKNKKAKVEMITTSKYTYPANLTKAQKKSFRAKARRAK